jgi:hypothetical protein
MTVLICLVYYYSRDIQTQDVVPASPPQKPVQAAYVCEAEDIVVRAWAEYDEAERQELEEEA